jgi:hypothetical protein
VLLGTKHDGGLTPSGVVRDYTPLQWKLPLPPGGRFEVRVWDERSSTSDAPFMMNDRLHAPEWFASPEETRRWPDKILWEVRVYDATDILVGQDRTVAERLPR